MSVEDDECPGRQSTSKTTENFEKIRDLIHKDRRWTIHEQTLLGSVMEFARRS
jgi:hypothetical protein